MIRVLHIMGFADAGGIESVVVNYYKHIDKEKFQFDFALTGNEPGMIGKEMISLGANFYRLPLKSKGLRQFKKSLSKLLNENQFDVVHVHESTTSYVALQVAKKCGIKCRIAHAHTSAPYISFFSELRRMSGFILNNIYATDLLACGYLAGLRVYGKYNMQKKRVIILPNSIDIHKFKFNYEKRGIIRREFGWNQEFVVGMVGRLSDEKNHQFALKIAESVHELNSNIHFVFVGAGALDGKIKEIIRNKRMGTYVSMPGRRSDVDYIYQGLDLCILPSIHEGFPVVAVEALASGLPVLLSNTITNELDFSNNAIYLPVNEECKWVEKICALSQKRDTGKRQEGFFEMEAHGFDVHDSTRKLERIYSSRIDSNIEEMNL